MAGKANARFGGLVDRVEQMETTLYHDVNKANDFQTAVGIQRDIVTSRSTPQKHSISRIKSGENRGIRAVPFFIIWIVQSIAGC